MRKIKLIVDYDGTAFKGFGRQKSERTVQGSLEAAISSLTHENVRVSGASRTDSGVHAHGQVVTFETPSRIPAERFSRALRAFLPADLVVKSCEEVPKGFDPRRRAKRKLYAYTIAMGEVVPAAVSRYVWHVRSKLDLKVMRKAAKALVGKHDFSSFAATGKEKRYPVKKLQSIKFASGRLSDFFGVLSGGVKTKTLRIEFVGDAFLHKMVRNIAGTLVDVGIGRIDPGSVTKILKARRRSAAGRTAPASGLTLMRIDF